MMLTMATLGFLGLWAGAKVGSYMSPEDELLMGYIISNEELSGSLLGGFTGLLLGFAIFCYGKRLLRQ
jgi:hypothetical protein